MKKPCGCDRDKEHECLTHYKIYNSICALIALGLLLILILIVSPQARFSIIRGLSLLGQAAFLLEPPPRFELGTLPLRRVCSTN